MQTHLKTTWQGHYFDGQSANRQQVTITVTPSGLHIVREDGSVFWWPYDRIHQTQGFYSGEQVCLEKGEGIPEVLVVTEDAFLTAIRQVAPDGHAHFDNPIRRVVWLKLALLAGAGVVMIGLVLYLWGIPVLADQLASRVPVSWEEQLGQVVVAHLAPPNKRCTDSGCTQALHQIVSTLTAAFPSPYTFRIIVVKEPSINAFAAPGGYIVVYQGLLQKTKTPEELAGVLAHEIQHVLHRHSTKALFREMSMRAIIATLTGDTKGLTYTLAAAETLGALRYRRRDEETADCEGMKMIQAARIDSEGMIRFFTTLQEGADVPRGMAYLSTHPHTTDRIEQLKRLAAQARYNPISLLPDYPWPGMQKICDASPAP